MPREIALRPVWDDDAEMWVAHGDGVGPVARAKTRAALKKKLDEIVPDLLRADSVFGEDDEDEVPLWLLAEMEAEK